MRRIYFALIISILWISTAFSEDYYPLRVGNQWSYVMSNNSQMVVEVTGYTEIDGVRCAVVESVTQSDMGTQTVKEYMAIDTKGLKVFISQSGDQEVVYSPPLTRIKLPFVQEEIWTNTIGQGDMELVTTFQSLGTKQVPTNMGNFECIAVGSRASVPGQTNMKSISYYADGVGMVRQEIQIGTESIVVSLVSANVQPSEKIEAPKPSKIKCPNPECEAINDSSSNFCNICGTKLVMPSSEDVVESITVDPNEEATYDLYKSTLRKLMFYKPRNWNVAELQYDNGANVTSIIRPDESALVVFLTFPEGLEDVNDSVSLAETCFYLFQNNIPDLHGDNVKTSPSNDLTTMNIDFTEGDAIGIGQAYFFYTDRVGTAYLLLARDDIWSQIRPTLINIASNIAYSTRDVEFVMNIAKTLASENIIKEQENIPNPASIIQKAGKSFPAEIEMVSSGLDDKSLSLDIPQGWYLEGQGLQFILTDHQVLKNSGLISKFQTVIPTPIATLGTINSSYQSPHEILSYILSYEDIGTDMEILGEVPCEYLNSVFAKEVKNMNLQRYQVDGRLIYAKFRNEVTEKDFLGVFSVQCAAMPMSSEWKYSIDGCWAPESDFNELLPLFIHIGETIQISKQPAQSDKEKEFQILEQLNRDFLHLVADSDEVFDEYLELNQYNILGREYSNWMFTQTTLGQGLWLAQNEDAKVSKSESWGTESTSGQEDKLPYNRIDIK